MIVLALTTSTPRGGVALASGDEVVARSSYVELRSHAEKLFASIDEICARAGVRREALGAVACDVGPGSFTGVRVGVAAANGIAFALGLPLFGVTSLEAMAVAALATDGRATEVVAAIDAQKGELFLGRFRRCASPNLAGSDVQPVGDFAAASRADAERVLLAARESGAIVVGVAAHELGIEGVARSDAMDLPDAGLVALVAARRVAAREPGVEAARGLAPVYVRAPDITLPKGSPALRVEPPASERANCEKLDSPLGSDADVRVPRSRED